MRFIHTLVMLCLSSISVLTKLCKLDYSVTEVQNDWKKGLLTEIEVCFCRFNKKVKTTYMEYDSAKYLV